MLMVLKYKVEEILGVIYGSTTRTGGAGGRVISVFQTLTGGKGTSIRRKLRKHKKKL